jgi:polysaccharide biosynthesis protein VpsM
MASPINLRLAVASLSLAAVPAQAFVEVARGNLNASINTLVEADSNIFGDNTRVSDELLTVTPELSYERNAGLLSLASAAGVDLVRFSDHIDQNSEDPYANLHLGLDQAEKGSAKADVSYARQSATNEAVLARTKSDEYQANLAWDYFLGDKTGLRFGTDYAKSDQLTAGFTSSTVTGFDVGSLYRYSPKLTANLVYGYRDTETTNNVRNSKDHRLSVGTEGEILSKLTGKISIGANYREEPKFKSSTSVYINSAVNWQIGPKTDLDINLSAAPETTAGAQTSQNYRLDVTLNQEFNAKLRGYFTAGVEQAKYTGGTFGTVARTDNTLPLSMGINYSINGYLNTQAGVSYRINNSDLAQADYDRTIYTVSLNAKF